jgi:hypothetical protein
MKTIQALMVLRVLAGFPMAQASARSSTRRRNQLYLIKIFGLCKRFKLCSSSLQVNALESVSFSLLLVEERLRLEEYISRLDGFHPLPYLAPRCPWQLGNCEV